MSTSQLASAVNCSQYCNAISSDWEHKTGYRESNDPLHDVSATYNVDVADTENDNVGPWMVLVTRKVRYRAKAKDTATGNAMYTDTVN